MENSFRNDDSYLYKFTQAVNEVKTSFLTLSDIMPRKQSCYSGILTIRSTRKNLSSLSQNIFIWIR